MILAVISAIAAVVMVVMSFMDIDIKEMDGYETPYYVIVAVGALIGACMYFTFGRKVRNGEVPQKIDILALYVRIFGIVMIIGGICKAVGEAVGQDNFDAGASIVGAIVAIVIGLIIIFIAGKINDGVKTTGDKVIWIILLVLFVLMIIASIMEIISIIALPVGICDLIVSVFMISLLTDPEVKSAMNM